MYRFADRMRTTLLTALVFALCSLLSFTSAQSEAPGRSGTEKSASSSQAGSVLQAYDQALDEVAERAMLSGGRDQSQWLWAARGRYQQPGDRETTGDWFGRDRFCGWIPYYQQSRGGWCTADPSHPGACYCGTRHLPHLPRPPATSLRSQADRCPPKSGSCLDRDRGRVSSVYCAGRAVPPAAWTDCAGDRISRGIGSHRHQGDRERGGTTAGTGPSHGVRTN
jgi:hypothetical protein